MRGRTAAHAHPNDGCGEIQSVVTPTFKMTSKPATSLHNIQGLLGAIYGTCDILYLLLEEIRSFPQYVGLDSKDPEVAEAVNVFGKVICIRLRSYVIKIYSLMEYIRDVEEYTYIALDEGDVEEFLDYLKQVCEMAWSCEQELSLELHAVSSKTELVGVQGKPVISWAGTFAGAAVPPSVAITGTFVDHLFAFRSIHGIDVTQAIEAMKSHLQIVKSCYTVFRKANESDHELHDITRRIVRRSMIQTIQEVVRKCNGIMQYYLQLKDTDNLDDFIKRRP